MPKEICGYFFEKKEVKRILKEYNQKKVPTLLKEILINLSKYHFALLQPDDSVEWSVAIAILKTQDEIYYYLFEKHEHLMMIVECN